MNGMRALLYFVGVALVLLSLWMFFTQANLNRWVPFGIFVSALILILGVSVMSFAEKRPDVTDVHVDRTIEERHIDTDTRHRNV